MKTVTSADGTAIAYQEQGRGPALVVVDGALCARGAKEGLAAALEPDFTVFRYDRRGRGDSGDTQPYAVEREIEDLAAVIGAAGGTAFLYGHSSGCALVLDTVLRARAAGGPEIAVPKIALYEAPYDDDPAAQGPWTAYLSDLAAALAAGRRGDAVARFMAHVGMPAEQIAGMRQSPYFPALEAIAPTLAYDHTGLLGDSTAVPVGQAARVTVPALVMYGDASFPFMRGTAEKLSAAMPHARLRVLEGQTHDVDPSVQAPVLAGFFAG
jgi:pimeloyl-ACP methyl ester carboxylesterase